MVSAEYQIRREGKQLGHEKTRYHVNHACRGGRNKQRFLLVLVEIPKNRPFLGLGMIQILHLLDGAVDVVVELLAYVLDQDGDFGWC